MLDKWNGGLHSWFGRCNILKMTILPKFLYLLQTIPIHIPADYFNQIRSIFIKFLWAGKKPRLHRKILSLPKRYGGLAMPELQTYYRATHLSRLIDWCRHTTTKLWTQLEQAQSAFPIHRIPWCYTVLPTDLKRHPLIGNTARVCAHLIDLSPLFTRNSPLKPILGNPLFEPGIEGRFRELREVGIYQASHFSVGGRWKTITELSDPEGQFRLDFLRSLQLHHFLSSMPPPNVNDQTLTPMEDLCSGTEPLLHSLSLTYSMLITPTGDYKLRGLSKWGKRSKMSVHH